MVGLGKYSKGKVKQANTHEPQTWKGLQDFPLQSFSWFSSCELSLSAIGVHCPPQQLCSVSVCNEILSIPGLTARNRIVVANMSVKNFIALQRYNLFLNVLICVSEKLALWLLPKRWYWVSGQKPMCQCGQAKNWIKKSAVGKIKNTEGSAMCVGLPFLLSFVSPIKAFLQVYGRQSESRTVVRYACS